VGAAGRGRAPAGARRPGQAVIAWRGKMLHSAHAAILTGSVVVGVVERMASAVCRRSC
jgi:hypothetical protein